MPGGAGAIFQTAARVIERPLTVAFLRQWGEAAWTAPELHELAYRDAERPASVGWMLGLPPSRFVIEANDVHV